MSEPVDIEFGSLEHAPKIFQPYIAVVAGDQKILFKADKHFATAIESRKFLQFLYATIAANDSYVEHKTPAAKSLLDSATDKPTKKGE